VLVVLGLSPTGLYVVREAAASGVKVYGFSDARECASSSRHLANRGAGTVVGMAQLDERLVQLASRYEHLAVIPTTDRHVDHMVERADERPGGLRLASAYTGPSTALGLDKTAIAAVARGAGLKVPDEHDLASGEFEPGAEELPIILKPKSIHRQRHWLKGRKLFLCQTLEEWRSIQALPHFKPSEWTAQALVHGPESNIKVAAVYRSADGSVECFTGSKLRQYPVNFGSASLLVSERDEAVEEDAVRLLEAMDFEGIAGVEFKRDSRDGELRLIEMNPRPSLWFSAATATGRFLVFRQLDEWFGEAVHRPQLPGSDGVTWRYAIKDRLALRAHRRGAVVPAIPAPDVRPADGHPTTWAVYARNDPGPAWRELAVYVRKAMGRLTR